MKITALVENISHCELLPTHGLSLYVEMNHHRILFDLGKDDTLFYNAALRDIDLTAVDTVVISHGHSDHGGALDRFLAINHSAKVYIQRDAFRPLYSMANASPVSIGIDPNLMQHPQIVLLDGDYLIDDTLTIFQSKSNAKCHSTANDTLYCEASPDSFSHEQNLILHEDNHTSLFMGCGHRGIVNILEDAASFHPDICIGGFHLYNPSTQLTVSPKLLEEIVSHLKQYEIQFYTCHCTGEEAFAYLSAQLNNITYLSCGDCISILHPTGSL